MRFSIPLEGGEALYYEPVKTSNPIGCCQVHHWPDEGFRKRLFRKMREAHSKGGVNVCTECLKRSKRT